MSWYIIEGYMGHVGAGRSQEVVIGLRAKDAVSALQVYNHLPTVKKHARTQKPRKYNSRFRIKNFFPPTIRLATSTESKYLHKKKLEARLSGNKKKHFYLDTFA